MDNITDILSYITTSEETMVLATIIKVEGSAYRKEGTSMLFTESGNQVGLISVGCLEDDLSIKAKNLLNNTEQVSLQVSYDMSAEDDLGWGRGAGCNGKVHILLEKVTEAMRSNILKVYTNLQRGFNVIAIKNLALVPGSIDTTYRVNDANNLQTRNIPSKKLNRIVNGKFYHFMKAKPRLIIFGAGEDVEPLVKLANLTGFSVFMWDWRPEMLCKKRFPNVNFVHHIDSFQINKHDYAIIMTHDFQKDKQLLQLLMTNQLKYLGVLGPSRRTSRLLNGKEVPPFIKSPVGLSIGSEGPNEISVSIIAELIQVKRGVSNVEQTENNWRISSGGEK